MTIDQIDILETGHSTVVKLRRTAVTINPESLRNSLNTVLEKKPALVEIDLQEVDMITSLVISKLLSFRNKAAEQNISIHILNMRPQLREIFRKLMLDQFFEIK